MTIHPFGQGSPLTRFGNNQSPDGFPSSASHRATAHRFWHALAGLLVTLIGPAVWPGGMAGLAAQEQLTLSRSSPASLRIVWGGGNPQTWQGWIRVSSGSIRLQAVLGMESDAGATLLADGDRLDIRSLRPTEFGGADLILSAPGSATLEMELQSTESAESRIRQSIPLARVLDRTRGPGLRIPLDDSGNVLDVRPKPENDLPVTIKRPHLVFSPGETFAFTLDSVPVPFSAGTVPRLNVRITPARADTTTSEQSLAAPVGDDQRLAALDVAIEVPQDEGAYNLNLALGDSSLGTRLGLGRNRLERTIQIVVVDDQPNRQTGQSEVALWREVQVTGIENNPWIPKIPGWQPWRVATDSKIQHDAGVRTIDRDGRQFTELSPGGWQAIPIRIDQLGKPHIIEVEYVDEGPMALGISVLQPDDSGKTGAFGADSGITVPETSAGGEPVVRRHQFFFWPRHKNPYLLFANRHARQPAVIGSVRVLAGPDHLASASTAGPRHGPTRQFMSFYEQPLFVDNFSVSRFIDPESGYAIDDWQSWLVGARRWVEYLKASGHTGAMLVVMSDGSALYPSALIQPTPRHDNGVLASSCVDPIRKDVVELLMRVFAQAGLQLVPVLDFNAPLPAVEAARAELSPGAAASLVLTNLAAESRLSTFRESGSGSCYNPLNSRVQSAGREIVAELAARYSQHASLGGVGLLLSRKSLPVIPGQSWGVDADTLAEFVGQQDTGELSQISPANLAQEILNGSHRDAWLDWRQKQMAAWYSDLGTTIGGSGKLFLLATDLFETQDAFSALVPSLRRRGDIRNAAARIGLPLAAIADEPHIVFLRPCEIAPEKSLSAKRLNYSLNHSLDGSGSASLPDGGLLFTHRYSWAHFEQLQQSRPFNQPDTHPIMRLQPLIGAEFWARQPLADGLLSGDPRYIVDGGWLTGLGQEQATSSWIETFTRLPDMPFREVEPANGTGSLATVVRQAVSDDHNWFYLVNPTPWELTVTLRLSGNHSLVHALSGEDWLLDDDGTGLNLTLSLRPFEIKAGTTDASVSITGYREQIDATVAARLQEQLDWLISRVSLAEHADPVDILVNPGFEPLAENADGGFGWYYDESSSSAIALQGVSPCAGAASLSMTSNGSPVWIRSGEIPVPETGRMSISVQLRTGDPDRQPPLRISVQGSDGEQLYYRFGSVGETDSESRPIGEDWREFAVHFDDLPPAPNQPVRIGFDLMGAGHVEIDEVRIYDRWLDKQDSNALTQQLQIAGYQLTSGGNIDKCRRILEGYWPRFLQVYFAEPSVVPAESTAAAAANDEPPRASRLQELIPAAVRPRR